MVKITKESWIRKRNCAILRFATGLKRKPFSKLMQILCNWHGVSTPPKNISQLGLLFPIYGTYKKCSKPPTRLTSKQTEQTLDTQVPGKNKQRIERAVHIYIHTHIIWTGSKNVRPKQELKSANASSDPQENTEDVQGGHHYLDDFLSSQT